MLPNCVQSYRTGALKGGGMGPETSHVHKITYGPLADTAMYVMCLMGANPLKGLWKGWAMKVKTFLGPETARAKGKAVWTEKSHRSINSYNRVVLPRSSII